MDIEKRETLNQGFPKQINPTLMRLAFANGPIKVGEDIVYPEQVIAAVPLGPSSLDKRIMDGIRAVVRTNPVLFHFVGNPDYIRQLFRNKALSLCRCDRFSDDADGLLPDANRSAESGTMKRMYKGFEEQAVMDGRRLVFDRDPQEAYDQQSLARKCSYVHCWFSGGIPSSHMWEVYGGASQGICLQTRVTDLVSAVQRHDAVEEVKVGGVTYSDCSEPIGTFDSYLPFCHKHEKYSNEQEVRLIAFIKPTPDGRYPIHDRLDLKVDLQRLLHRVILGPRMPLKLQEEVRGLFQDEVGDVEVVNG